MTAVRNVRSGLDPETTLRIHKVYMQLSCRTLLQAIHHKQTGELLVRREAKVMGGHTTYNIDTTGPEPQLAQRMTQMYQTFE